jgi:hypothetical protein
MKSHAGCDRDGQCEDTPPQYQGMCRHCGGVYAVNSNCNSYNLDGESEVCTPCWDRQAQSAR